MAQILGPAFGLGTDGSKVISGTENINQYTGCSGSSGGTALTVVDSTGFSVGDLVLINKSRGVTTTDVGSWELNRISAVAPLELTLSLPLANTYQDSGAEQSQVIVIPEYTDVTIGNGDSITPTAWDGDKGGIVAMAVSGLCDIQVGGTINVTGKGSNQNGAGRNGSGNQGEGSEGAGGVSGSANGSGGGGGEDGVDGSSSGGAGGGHAVAGSDGPSYEVHPGGTGGEAIGNAELTVLNFGGEGGAGGARTSSGGAGGDGGGIVLLLAHTLVVAGTITSHGSSGGNGVGGDDAGGGGGAGGSILIKSQSATLGSGLITATGGAKGNGTGGGQHGATGAVGRIRIETCSLSGTTSPAASEKEGGSSWCGSLAAII